MSLILLQVTKKGLYQVLDEDDNTIENLSLHDFNLLRTNNEILNKVYKSRVCRIYPNQEQVVYFEQAVSHARKIWNLALEDITNILDGNKGQEQQDFIKQSLSHKNFISYKAYKQPYMMTSNIGCTVYQSSVQHLETAFNKFIDINRKKGFKQEDINKHCKGYPKFKTRKHSKQSFTVTKDGNNPRLEGSKLIIPKLKSLITIKNIKDIIDRTIVEVTISKSKHGKWYASITYIDYEVLQPKQSKSVGIDLGIRKLLTLSDGTIIPNFDKDNKAVRLYNKVKHHQRLLSNKEKGSKNYEKQRKLLASSYMRLHNYIINKLHSITNNIINDNQVICVESLNIKGMLGNKVISKKLSKSYWGIIKRQLEYKSYYKQRQYIEIDRWFPSSKICYVCGNKNKHLKSEETWTCSVCGTTHDRDYNASINILNKGLQLLGLQTT